MRFGRICRILDGIGMDLQRVKQRRDRIRRTKSKSRLHHQKQSREHTQLSVIEEIHRHLLSGRNDEDPRHHPPAVVSHHPPHQSRHDHITNVSLPAANWRKRRYPHPTSPPKSKHFSEDQVDLLLPREWWIQTRTQEPIWKLD